MERFSAGAGVLSLAVVTSGRSDCATTTIEPGHGGFYFAPASGGLRRNVLQPGTYPLGWCFLACTPNRVDVFDVTYSTRTERIRTKISAGLDLDLILSVIHRPIVSELYQLDTEIGSSSYDEVIGPEFRYEVLGLIGDGAGVGGVATIGVMMTPVTSPLTRFFCWLPIVCRAARVAARLIAAAVLASTVRGHPNNRHRPVDFGRQSRSRPGFQRLAPP